MTRKTAGMPALAGGKKNPPKEATMECGTHPSSTGEPSNSKAAR